MHTHAWHLLTPRPAACRRPQASSQQRLPDAATASKPTCEVLELQGLQARLQETEGQVGWGCLALVAAAAGQSAKGCG